MFWRVGTRINLVHSEKAIEILLHKDKAGINKHLEFDTEDQARECTETFMAKYYPFVDFNTLEYIETVKYPFGLVIKYKVK